MNDQDEDDHFINEFFNTDLKGKKTEEKVSPKEPDTSKLIYLKNHRKWSKYLKDGEEAITEDELRRRKRQYFTDKLFYKELCILVDKINVLQGKKLSP